MTSTKPLRSRVKGNFQARCVKTSEAGDSLAEFNDFAIVHDGEKTSKFANPKHLAKHERNLARKQAKLAKK